MPASRALILFAEVLTGIVETELKAYVRMSLEHISPADGISQMDHRSMLLNS